MRKLLFLLAIVIAAGFTTCKDPDNRTDGKKTYTITFNANGGDGTMQTQQIPENTSANLRANTFTRIGYTFTGWAASSTGSKEYDDQAIYTASAGTNSITLYAVWASESLSEEFPASVVSLVQSTTVTQAANFTYDQIKALVTEAVTLAGGLEGIVKSGDVVVLKPNVLTTYYGWQTSGPNTIPEKVNGVCTDWRVIQATAELVRGIIGPYDSGTGKGKIMLIEGSCNGDMTAQFNNIGYTPANLSAVNEIIGLDSEGNTYSAGAASTAGDILTYNTQVTLTDYKYRTVPTGSYQPGGSPYQTYYKGDGKYWVNKKMYEADALISIPVVKNHWDAAVTGAIKNISIGAAPPKIYGISSSNIGRNGMVNHASINLHEWIADFFSCLPVDFVVMDGLQGLQNGPGTGSSLAALQGNQKNLRSILASKDALAIDTVEANIINWNYTTVPYMTYLAARGTVGPKPNGRVILLRGDTKDIVVLGNKKVDDIRTDFAGNLPPPGGDKLTAAQLAKPTVTINSAAFSGQNLNLALTLSTGANNNVVKIDVYIDGAYTKSFNANMAGILFDASGLAAGSHNIEVRAYTKFMSCAAATAAAVK
jgi:uncharacterized repeat protein (TIGR02543 family)